MPKLRPREAPPPDYYAQNLDFVLSEVLRRNADLLIDSEHRFIAAWYSASVAARRLFARLLTRKGPWFRTRQLVYQEVPDPPGTVRELQRLGLVVVNGRAPADALLRLFTRTELSGLFPRVRAASKADWIDACVARYPDHRVLCMLADSEGWLAIADRVACEVCLLLFFGSDRQDLTEFVLQDLGMLEFERYPIDARTRPFAARQDLDAYRRCRALSAWFEQSASDPDVARVIRMELRDRPDGRTSARIRDRLLNRLGQHHERRGEIEDALECYRLSRTHPARERYARLLARSGDDAGLQELLDSMLEAPWSAEEEDYAVRKSVSRGRVVKQVLHVIEQPWTESSARHAQQIGVEAHALELLVSEGGSGWHLENHLPLGLAGLLFWEEVFAPVSGAFAHPLQSGPRDLYWNDFAQARMAALRQRETRLRVSGEFQRVLLETSRRKRGITNRLVNWEVWSEDLVESLASVSQSDALVAIAVMTIQGLERSRRGFPDLTLIRPDGSLAFVEVKGPTDQLQPAQRTWLRRLAALEIEASVLRFRP